MMDLLSYHHDLVDRILVRPRISDRPAGDITYVERCLRTINGIKSIERIKRDDLFLIALIGKRSMPIRCFAWSDIQDLSLSQPGP